MQVQVLKILDCNNSGFKGKSLRLARKKLEIKMTNHSKHMAHERYLSIACYSVYAINSLFVAVIALKIVDVFFAQSIARLPLYLWLYPIYFLIMIYSLSRSKYAHAFSYFIVLAFLCGITLSGVYFKSTPFVESQKLKMFSEAYEKCKIKGIAINNNEVLSLCESYDRIGYFDGIVYDSSDQIALPRGDQSKEWRSAVGHYALFAQFSFTAKKIGDHFYYVRFDQ